MDGYIFRRKQRDANRIYDKYYVLYTLPSEDGDIDGEIYYEGGNPLDESENKNLISLWEGIPEEIRSFYENIHNGFYYYAGESMGLVRKDLVTFFDDDEWGIIDELTESLKINLKTTFGFFKSGMGGYVAIDCNNCSNNNATLWWASKQPKYNVDFWDLVDEWIVIGFQS